MEIEAFKDRISANPNRRKLKIINHDEIIADIEYAEVATQEGTPLNAESLVLLANWSVQMTKVDQVVPVG